MTVQRRLLLGFSLMVLPVLLVGVQAVRSNALERRALEALGEGLARNRTFSQVENASLRQTEAVWRYLTGLDPGAKNEFRLTGDVVDYWLNRWRAELRPDEQELANSVEGIHRQIRAVADSVFQLYDAGRPREAYVAAQLGLKERLQPALERVSRDIYRRARESSVQQGFARLEEIVEEERRILLWIAVLAVGTGILGSLVIARALARTQAQLVQTEKLASIGEMAAAVAHGLRNPLASLRAAAQFARGRPEAPAAREHLDAIIREVDRLDRRIAHLLT